jgi:hypothetical protein
MTYEDFSTFFYPVLFILAALLSLIPAYVAFKRNKNFWVWWISTAAVFGLLLFILIRIQAFSMLIYSPLVLIIASILAVIPKSDRVKVDFPLLTFLKKGRKLYPSQDGWLFLSALLVMLIVSGVLYYFLALGSNLDPTLELLRYYATKRVVFFIASLGYASFMFVVSEKRIRYVLVNIALVALLSVPFFQKPSRAYGAVDIVHFFIFTDILLGVLITDLIRNPIVGIYILLGICSGCMAIAVVLNDRYQIVNNLFVPQNFPLLRLSKNPYLSSYILTGVLLLGLIAVLLSATGSDGSILILWPLAIFGVDGIYLFALLWIAEATIARSFFVIVIASLLFSTIVIVISIKQSKALAAIAVFVAGILSIYAIGNRSNLFWIIGSYSFGSGFAALVLWVLSDYLLPHSNQDQKTYDLL